MATITHFGPYEIIRRLGKSMNDVYLAHDTRVNRQAALKLVKSGPDAVSRLVMEAERRGAAIQQGLRALDPRVIEVYDYGTLDGYFFVAMQYVEGRSLSEVLAGEGRLGADRAARIALEICRQLEKFHAFRPGDGTVTSVVHGDIKPSNIHLGPHETVRLLDFGIAKTLRPDRDSTLHNFGSPSYCSPERLGRSAIDPQADLWAVGATLYEMAAGSPPYQAENTRKLEKLIQSRRPPRALPASCPPALKAVVGKALAPDPQRRYPSAAAFASDLEALLDGAETAAEQEKRGSWKPNPTLEAARGLSAAPHKRRLLRRALRITARIGAALACILTGMLLFIGTSFCSRYWRSSHRLRAGLDYSRRSVADINADWALYQNLASQFAFLGGYSPVKNLCDPLRAAYTQAGTRAVNQSDWERATLCLARATELGATSPETLSRLALARGYALLNAHPANVQAARRWFAEAAGSLPQWPDPHLGLAQADLLPPITIDGALAELRQAAHLGYRLQAPEVEPVAEALRLRGFDRLEDGDDQAARHDFSAARSLYRTTPGLASRLSEIPSLQPPPAPRATARRYRRRRR